MPTSHIYFATPLRSLSRYLASLVLVLIAVAPVGATPLDAYVAAPDPAYRYELQPDATVTMPTVEAKVYYMASQHWLKDAEVDRTLWEHWVVVYVPKERTHTPAMVFIDGGSNGGKAPGPDHALAQIAVQTHSVVVAVKQIPNQPLHFTEEKMDKYKEKGRGEDALITYGWDKFLNGGRAEWLARLPMTKAVVRAMDLVQKEQPSVDAFFVMGGSKRAWTTWTVAAVDKRVIGIAPAVIDVLNFVPSLDNHIKSYGFWAPAVGNYEEMNITGRYHSPRMRELLDIVDPYSYVDRLTMPKYIVNATGDQFFPPNSSQYYFDGLQGEKYLRYMPNTDHGLSGEAFLNAASFYNALLTKTPRPEFTWKSNADGSLEVDCATAPKKVLLWQAHNPKARDFRLEEIGKAWTSTPLTGSDGVYRALPDLPGTGYTAFMIELTFENPTFPLPFVFTTGVNILPDTYPGK
ncbi:MAG: PhoPQ-activated pathogenicity-related family protein [Candidatus Hydrogenedentes bacterium]|nr:PhoPQ-activated pathogenicity-related family protein [Candidatus Hydrogenedentota bacterium]